MELQIGEILLELGGLFLASTLLGLALKRLRIPVIIGALLVAMAATYTPLGARLTSPEQWPVFTFVGELGVLFLLFFIGLQIDLRELSSMKNDIVWLTVLNTIFPFVLGVTAMVFLGFGWGIALVVGLTRMPTAEAVIVPILDEFDLVNTRVGRFIIGTGTLDDVIEVVLVALVSVWIAEKMESGTAALDLYPIAVGLMALVGFSWLSYRWLVPWLSSRAVRTPRDLVRVSIVVLLLFGGLTELSGLGLVVGAISAGVVMRSAYRKAGQIGEHVMQTFREFTYGFMGLGFFFWVGLSVDVEGIVTEPLLAILLFLAATVGKLAGALLMVPMRRLDSKEAWTVGIGINARLTTEIIVAQLLYGVDIIDVHLFTALVAASSVSTLMVPLAFTLVVDRWGDELRGSSTQPGRFSRSDAGMN